MNVNLEGLLNVATGKAIAHRIVVETAKSNLRGTASATISANPSWEIRLDSAGVQAADLLNWYRAFQPDVDDAVMVKQYFTGAMTLRGWPVQITDAAFSSEGGEARIPGICFADTNWSDCGWAASRHADDRAVSGCVWHRAVVRSAA